MNYLIVLKKKSEADLDTYYNNVQKGESKDSIFNFLKFNTFKSTIILILLLLFIYVFIKNNIN